MESTKRIFIDIHTHHQRDTIISPTMAGVHPWQAEESTILPDLSACDIIGETGLDYARDISHEAQERLFREHLREAERLHKPVVLHVVRALNDTLRILADYTLQGVVIHGFIGTPEQAAMVLQRGYYLSFGLRSLRSPKSRRAIAITPLDRLFCETDDEATADIAEVYRQVAEIKRIAVDELLSAIEKNYRELIVKDDR